MHVTNIIKCNCLSSPCPRMYAHDTHLTFVYNDISVINDALNRDLDLVNNWLISNKLTLNTSITEFMLIGSRQRLRALPRAPSICLDGAHIDQVSSVKSLGVYIDENLSWNTHIDQLSNKISSGIRALKRICSFVPPVTLHSVFNSFVQPHFNYCSVVWDTCNITLSRKLEKLQKPRCSCF